MNIKWKIHGNGYVAWLADWDPNGFPAPPWAKAPTMAEAIGLLFLKVQKGKGWQLEQGAESEWPRTFPY